MKIMAHLVAGYTTDEIARAAARGLAEGGVSYFEVQLPFSDPAADGPAIQTACAEVLSRSYRVSQGFSFVKYLTMEFPTIPVFIMTYTNLVWNAGIDAFVRTAANVGAKGLIVPDLPFDHDEGLSLACTKRGLCAVPVVAPSMTQHRLALLAKKHPEFVYAALRPGITGQETEIDIATLSFINSIGVLGSSVLAGFGIRSGKQVSLLAPHVHAVVAGSVFVNGIRDSCTAGAHAVCEVVRERALNLTTIK